jgi:hypothetical protein
MEQMPVINNANNAIVTPIPLIQYYSAHRQDHTLCGIAGGQYSVCPSTDTPYLYERIEGYCSEAHLKGTTPLNFFWHGRKQDNVVTSAQKVKPSHGGYTFVRVDCYVWEKQVDGLVALDLYYSKKRKDHLVVATKEGREWATANNYIFVATQGYVYQPYIANGQAANDLLSLQTGCTDLHPNCSKWAAEGECSANAHYMLYNCGFSCGVCSDSFASSADGAAANALAEPGHQGVLGGDKPKSSSASMLDPYQHRSSAWDFLQVDHTPKNLSVQLRSYYSSSRQDWVLCGVGAEQPLTDPSHPHRWRSRKNPEGNSTGMNCTDADAELAQGACGSADAASTNSSSIHSTLCPGEAGDYSFQRVEGYCSRVQLAGTTPLFFYLSQRPEPQIDGQDDGKGANTTAVDHLVMGLAEVPTMEHKDTYKLLRVECYVWKDQGEDGSATHQTRVPLQLYHSADTRDHATVMCPLYHVLLCHS